MESIIPLLLYSMPAILAFPSIDLVQNFKLNYPLYIAKWSVYDFVVQLGGIVTPNDGKCHLKKDVQGDYDFYSKSNEMVWLTGKGDLYPVLKITQTCSSGAVLGWFLAGNTLRPNCIKSK